MLINDLNQHILVLRREIDAAVARVLARGWVILGPEGEDFEKSFAAYLGVSHCVTVANGTDALELAMKALGVREGDRVATVANAGMYTTTAILAINAEPVYMDVDIGRQVVLRSEIDRVIALGAKTVVVTHLYGQAVPYISEIAQRCRAAGIALLEDCAQAHGARIGSQLVGSFGDAGCFSFYPTKNLGALGDGGAITTNSSSIAEQVARLRQYGWSSKYCVELAGARNSRLDEVQAAVLSAFLPYLDAWNTRRRQIARKYTETIRNPGVSAPPVGGGDYVAHLYVLRATNRDSLRKHLRDSNIATEIHYPIPDYRQPVFADRFSGLSLDNSEQLAHEVLSLPCYPEMTDSQVDEVIAVVNSWRP